MNEDPPVAEPHPDVLTKEDLVMLGYILGAYAGNVMNRVARQGRDPVHDPEAVKALEMTGALKKKIAALSETM